MDMRADCCADAGAEATVGTSQQLQFRVRDQVLFSCGNRGQG